MSSGTTVSLCFFINHWNMCLTGLIITYVSKFVPTAAENRGEPQPLSMPASPSAPPLLSPRAEDVEAVPRPGNIAAESV